jgi:hypothetical protein
LTKGGRFTSLENVRLACEKCRRCKRSSLFVCSASDEENKRFFNSGKQFYLLNPSEYFKIGSTSGAIHTTGKPFDREEQVMAANISLVMLRCVKCVYITIAMHYSDCHWAYCQPNCIRFQERHELVVEVRSDDHARVVPRVARVIVDVEVIDINDNAPMFINQVSISQNFFSSLKEWQNKLERLSLAILFMLTLFSYNFLE